MSAHDLRHLGSVRRTTSRRVDYFGGLTERLRTDRGWRDHAERLYVLASVVVEPVHGAARNAECLRQLDVGICGCICVGSRVTPGFKPVEETKLFRG